MVADVTGWSCVDSFVQYFVPEELPCWNLLWRTRDGFSPFLHSARLAACWVVGCAFRYALVLVRVPLVLLSLALMLLCTFLVGCVPGARLRQWLFSQAAVMLTRLFSLAFCLHMEVHNPENRPKTGIVVANHTTSLDAIFLTTDNSYLYVGQQNSGFEGLLLKLLCRAGAHIFFDRKVEAERQRACALIQQHAQHPERLPLLLFPEGSCTNNTGVMMFRKGSFEATPVVHPVAMRYDARFGDAFWRAKETKPEHFWRLLTCWAIVVQVWYLKPVERRAGESAIAFAARVKRRIAEAAGIEDRPWDAYRKRDIMGSRQVL